MRGKSNKYLKDRLGEKRVVHKFLLFPRSFGTKHWRWLEYADILYKICQVDVGALCEWGNYAYKWVAVGFADEATTK